MSIQTNKSELLLVVLAGIVFVFMGSRLTAQLILESQIFPHWLSPNFNGFRLHHFVYGNIIILITSFLAIVWQTRIKKTILAGLYGVGLGLVLDEFPHWMGYIPELESNAIFIPLGAAAVLSATAIILGLMCFRSRIRRK